MKIVNKILAINAGSSSLKFQLIEMPEENVITKGLVERIGLPESVFTIEVNGEKQETVTDLPEHGTAVQMLVDKLTGLGIIDSLDEIEGIGHRVVHGGERLSIAAIEGGKSVDTSMGFTPLAGVTMGTRSGNIDPALIPYIMQKTGKSAEEVLHVLNKESGMLALSGFSSDLRDIEDRAAEGDERAELALEVFAARIHKYIGSYAARMHGVDAIVFTAGVGENSTTIRERVLKGLEFMGVYWDPSLNQVRGKEAFVSYPHSPVKVMVIPTNEEVMIARDTVRLIEENK